LAGGRFAAGFPDFKRSETRSPTVARASKILCPGIAAQTPLVSPPSIRIDAPVIHFAAGETSQAIRSAISSGLP